MSGKQKNIEKSLLEKLTSSQINDLLVENELTKKGYTFYYCIDSRDINKYCFPCGVDGSELQLRNNFELLTDEISAYYNFFNNINETKPVFLFSQYYKELNGLKNKIKKQIENGKIFDISNNLLDYLNSSNNSNNIKNDFTLFISIATGQLHDGVKKLKELADNDFFILSEFELGTKENHIKIKNLDYLITIFEKYDISNNINDPVYLELEFLIFDAIYKFRNSNNSKRKSTLLDSEAIASIFFMNTELLKSKNKKLLFLYLSSSGASSTLFNNNLIQDKLPFCEGLKVNFHRTIEQLFINFLFKDLSLDEKQIRLRKAIELAEYKQKNDNIHDTNSDSNSRNIINLIDENLYDLRENYTNLNFSRKDNFNEIESIYHKISDYSNHFTNSENNLSSLNKLFNSLKSNYSKVSSENVSTLFNVLENTIKISYVFSITYKNVFTQFITSDKNEFTINRGADKIKAAGQHLPLVFKSHKKKSSFSFDYVALLYLEDFAFMQADNIELVKSSIIDLSNKLLSSKINTINLHDKIILCLCLIIMPQTNTKDNENISLIAEEFLIEIYKNEVTSKTKRNIESDLLYILSWICRRNKNYSAALKYTEIGLEKFTDDARFYHSRFLINYCKLSELILTESQILSNYNEQLNDIKKAAELYPSLLKTKKKQIKNNITYTILNSEIYTEVLILENNNIHNKHLILNDIRTKLKKLKSLSGSNYFNYPEFLHTESSLEYLEYQYDCTDTESKLNKLNNAIYTINNGIIKAKMYPNFDITDFYNLLEILAIEKEKLKQLNDVNHTVNL